jgi:hypothetical protein
MGRPRNGSGSRAFTLDLAEAPLLLADCRRKTASELSKIHPSKREWAEKLVGAEMDCGQLYYSKQNSPGLSAKISPSQSNQKSQLQDFSFSPHSSQGCNMEFLPGR